MELDDSDTFLPSEDATPVWVSSPDVPASPFSSQAMDKSLDVLGLEDPSSEYWMLDEWDRTGEPVRFDGAIHLARQWIASPPAADLTDRFVPFVLLLLGWSRSETEVILASEALVPYLQHDMPRARWAAALSLGWLRDERAIPTLKRMLTEYLPEGDAIFYEEQEGHPYDVRLDWWRSNELMKVILHLNDPSFAPPLRAALAWMLDLERRWVAAFGSPLQKDEGQREWPHLNSPGIERWAWYQDILVFALGRMGALDAIEGLDCPIGFVGVQAWTYLNIAEERDIGDGQRIPFRALLWRVHAAFGFLFDELPHFRLQRMSGGIPQFVDYQGLEERITPLLEEVFHLDSEARSEAMRYYERSMYLLKTMDLSRETLNDMYTRQINSASRVVVGGIEGQDDYVGSAYAGLTPHSDETAATRVQDPRERDYAILHDVCAVALRGHVLTVGDDPHARVLKVTSISNSSDLATIQWNAYQIQKTVWTSGQYRIDAGWAVSVQQYASVGGLPGMLIARSIVREPYGYTLDWARISPQQAWEKYNRTTYQNSQKG